MKKLDNIDQLDALFKSHLDKAQVTPPPGVWSSIASSAGMGSTGVISQLTSYFSSVTNLVKVALFAGGITTAGVLLYQANTAKHPEETGVKTEQVELADERSSSETTAPVETIEQETGTSETVIVPPASDHEQSPEFNAIDPADGEGTSTEYTTTQESNGSNPENSGSAPASIASESNRIVTASGMTCLGDSRTFLSGNEQDGDWYINGVLVKRSSDAMTHVFNLAGDYLIELKQGSAVAAHQLSVGQLMASIVAKDLNNGQYELSLSDGKMKVNRWLLNGGELSSKQVIYPRLKPGKVKVTAELTDGKCSYTVEKEIDVKGKGSFSAPNIFTPNGDGLNDDFTVKISNYEYFYIVITDRSGVKMFESTNPQVGWNGRAGNFGEQCASGEYLVKVQYKLEGGDLETKLIRLTLKRQ